jgi:hypothetical protein
MFEASRDQFRASPEYQPFLRMAGLDAHAVFNHPDIKVWRSIPERENCILDTQRPDGSNIRLHIKRYRPQRGFPTPADDEANGIRALNIEQVPTAPLVGWGNLADGRSFIITEDLAGYRALDKLIEEGLGFEQVLEPTAALAARLHNAGLHHRDLYLCHFFAKIQGDTVDLKLIDAARVKRLPGWPLRHRWIIKDLAQFWYSALQLGISYDLSRAWLETYAKDRNLDAVRFLSQVQRKSAWIERHDAKLTAAQPTRNVSIPGG